MGELSNTDLKVLAELYWEKREELYKLQRNYIKSGFEMNILTNLYELLKDVKSKKGYIYFEALAEKIKDRHDKITERHNNNEKEYKKSSSQNEIELKMAELDTVKNLLGPDYTKQMEENEKKAIVRYLPNWYCKKE